METKNWAYICPECTKKMIDNKANPTQFIFWEKVEINIPYNLYDLVEEHLVDWSYLRNKFDFYMYEEWTVVWFNDSLTYGDCRTYDIELQSWDYKTVVNFPRYMLTPINEEYIDDEEYDDEEDIIDEEDDEENLLLNIDLSKLDDFELECLEDELERFADKMNKKYNK